ncbi:MAG: polysaccharide deacetylase family protein [Clostridia bacterium]|nr:polysaccharide deacetylase family protein [Clostridia bacterium]
MKKISVQVILKTASRISVAVTALCIYGGALAELSFFCSRETTVSAYNENIAAQQDLVQVVDSIEYTDSENTFSPTATPSSTKKPTIAPTSTQNPTVASTPTPSSTPKPTKTPTPATPPPVVFGNSNDEQLSLPVSSVILRQLDVTYVSKFPNYKTDYWVNTDTHPVYTVNTSKKKEVEKYGGIVEGDKSESAMYLTFNLSSTSFCIDDILDILEEKKVKATFFVLGEFIDFYPEQFNRIYNAGHCIANHSYFHCVMPDKDIEYAANNLVKLDDVVNKALGTTTRTVYYRPPSGTYSERDLALAASLGYTPVFWSFTYSDYSCDVTMGKTAALELLVSNISNGAIYQLHACNTDNVQALPEFIDAVRAKGIEFKTLNDPKK